MGLWKTVLRGVVYSSLAFAISISQARAISLLPFEWAKTDFEKLKNQAVAVLKTQKLNSFTAHKALKDRISSTIKFTQTYQGIEVLGSQALFHYTNTGELTTYQTHAFNGQINTTPSLTPQTALRVLDDRYQSTTQFSEAPELKVFQDFTGKPHLIYAIKTATTKTQQGMRVFLDAHTGEVVLETPRECHAFRTHVYRADTDAALSNINLHGYPVRFDTALYVKAVNNNELLDSADRSVLNAVQHAKRTYDYYFKTFGRRSYDDKDSPIQSVVHAGFEMSNAFWSDEKKLMVYGDGDGEYFTDFTYALDLTAHELTHGVTASEADLVYAGEPGALNESYSDFFAKMVDYHEGNWNWGEKLVGRALGQKAARNLEEPELFGQPGSNNSKLRVPVTKTCDGGNDYCGVHTNSGIPNRAAALIVKDIGKEKTERMYYNVLTQRLTPTSSFREAREATEGVCKEMYGANSYECTAVTHAFNTVGM